MAGSFDHVVDDNGGLGSNEEVVDMLESPGDVYEAIEQMYGMIWYLAEKLEAQSGFLGQTTKDFVVDARDHYTDGLVESPTSRYRKHSYGR